MTNWDSWGDFGLVVAIALGFALALAALVSLALYAVRRRKGWSKRVTRRVQYPLYSLVTVVALRIALQVAAPEAEWLNVAAVLHVLLILTIAAAAWFVSRVINGLFRLTLTRYRVDVRDNRVARRVHTQVNILSRIAGVVIVIVAIGAILLTFPGVEAVGASLLASAGLASVVAGLAAQSTLSNVFAGMQLAFSDAVRVDDVVIAEGEWGIIEEITLTYIVVKIWDDRRLVLPSTYFTSTPFENWTRRSSELLGSVEFDLDWRVSPAQMREELDRILDRTELWDRRVKVLQVTEATGGYVRVRILVTAMDAPTLFDLRCFVREEMIEWMHRNDPAALPRMRLQTIEADADTRAADAQPTGGVEARSSDHEGLYTGSIEAQQRAAAFTTTIPIVEGPPEQDGELPPNAESGAAPSTDSVP